MSTIPNSRRCTGSRWGRVAGSLLLAGILAALGMACGGGTDVAPADPTAEGDGLATAVLDGVSYGSTSLVESVASLGSTQTVSVTDEVVTFGADELAQLAEGPLLQLEIVVTGPGGAPEYLEDTDYEVDRSGSVLTRLPGGGIPAGGTVEVDYQWVRTYFNLSVGVTFVAGASIQVQLFNLDNSSALPLTLPRTETLPPATFEPAFNVVVEEDLTASSGRRTFATVTRCDTTVDPTDCPVMNVAVLSDVSLANILNPCVAASLAVTLTNQNDSDPTDRSVLTLEFDDPLCD